MRSGLVRILWVTSSGSMVIGAPLLSTISAAWGSAKILNSAAGVMLPPLKWAPPMITISRMPDDVRGLGQGQRELVSGPSMARVTLFSGAARRVRIR